jgi:hypothetical protein
MFRVMRLAANANDLQTAALTHVAPATKGEDATTIGISAGAGAVIGGRSGGCERITLLQQHVEERRWRHR